MTVRRTAAILVTGSEILLGRTQDRNSGTLARSLDAHGVRLERIVTVDDREEHLRAALDGLLAEGHDLIITSGGLGPTHDDRTVAIVAEATGRALVLDEPVLAEITAIVTGYAAQRGVPVERLLPGAIKQSMVPAGAHVLSPAGTAPGVIVPGATTVVVLPGPPTELAEVWAAALVHPVLADLISAQLERRILRIWSTPESTVARAFEALGGDDHGTETSICATRLEVEVVVRFPPEARVAGNRLADGLVEEFGAAVYAEDDLTIEARVVAALCERGLTSGTAESCTAGMIAARLGNVPGASATLRGGFVAYANDVKTAQVGVPAELIERHGAVSAEVARALAEGVRERLGCDVGIGVTGVAGPGGGSEAKPVGLVHIAVVGPHGLGEALERRFPGDREAVRTNTATAALHLVRLLLQRLPAGA
ncbi:MAG: nicotinamide-nucleotide amidohydrolase family protein [Gaiellales bacterium]|nr:nicotinamide-nucleotide amidohydrolase family protein [Gaiellales bacterium]